jgi:hypothetical protein
MDITIGRIVHYRLTEEDAQLIRTLRASANQLALPAEMQEFDVRAGEVYPAIAVKVYGPHQASLQVFIDAPFPLWAKGRSEGEGVGEYLWPEYVGSSQSTEPTGSRR